MSSGTDLPDVTPLRPPRADSLCGTSCLPRVPAPLTTPSGIIWNRPMIHLTTRKKRTRRQSFGRGGGGWWCKFRRRMKKKKNPAPRTKDQGDRNHCPLSLHSNVHGTQTLPTPPDHAPTASHPMHHTNARAVSLFDTVTYPVRVVIIPFIHWNVLMLDSIRNTGACLTLVVRRVERRTVWWMILQCWGLDGARSGVSLMLLISMCVFIFLFPCG